VHFELRLAAAECDEHPGSDELALLGVGPGRGADIAGAVRDDVMGQCRGDVGQGVDDLLPDVPVERGQDLSAAVAAGLVVAGLVA